MTASALFLKLIEYPRPRISIPYRFPGVDDELSVQAVLPSERAASADSGRASNMVAVALLDNEGDRVFRSGRELERSVEPREYGKLVSSVLRALQIISPHYGHIDSASWERRLLEGAESNSSIAISMGMCVDVAAGLGGTLKWPRPDRYWGCAPRELLDGHWMAYRAARELYERVTRKN